MSSSSNNGVYVCELNLGNCSCEDRGSFDVSTDVGQAEFASFSNAVQIGTVLLVALVGNSNNAISQDSSTISNLTHLGVVWNSTGSLTGYSLCSIALVPFPSFYGDPSGFALSNGVVQTGYETTAQCNAEVFGKTC